MSNNTPGISYFDLLDWARNLESAWSCHIHYEMHPPTPGMQGVAWIIRCVARWYGETGKLLKERGEGSVWPNRDHKTLCGLELYLLTLLEQKIQEEASEKEKSKRGQHRLPGF
jgi:hypothetical protein